VFIRDAALIHPDEIPWEIDLIFYDCHNFRVQRSFHQTMLDAGKITKDTLLVLHDTNLHPYKTVPHAYEIEGGFVHQPDERKMVNAFAEEGWSPLCIHTKPSAHSEELPFRHGITIMQRFKPLTI
jgi:hypothetical protein